MSSSQDDSLKRIFRFLPYLLALIGLGMFLYTLFGDDEPPMQSIYWFLLVVAAFFLPYIKEITFQDIKLKLEEGLEKQQEALEDTREELEAAIRKNFEQAASRVDRVDREFGKIRNELIRGYQIYLAGLEPEERDERVVYLNTLYFEEMGVEVIDIKHHLKKNGFYEGEENNHYGLNLVAAIKAFQEKLGMVPDGIFGHNSYKKLVAYGGEGQA